MTLCADALDTLPSVLFDQLQVLVIHFLFLFRSILTETMTATETSRGSYTNTSVDVDTPMSSQSSSPRRRSPLLHLPLAPLHRLRPRGSHLPRMYPSTETLKRNSAEPLDLPMGVDYWRSNQAYSMQ